MKKNGLYQMKCVGCPLKHIRQTDRIFYTRYKEHIQTIRINNGNSEYSNHILSAGHAYGGITDTIKIMKIEKNGQHLNTLVRYHTYIMSVETDGT
jgi:hypothetical protein